MHTFPPVVHHLFICRHYWAAAVIIEGADSDAALLLSGLKYSEQCVCVCVVLYNYTEGRAELFFTLETSG